jgi:hypothetical protein
MESLKLTMSHLQVQHWQQVRTTSLIRFCFLFMLLRWRFCTVQVRLLHVHHLDCRIVFLVHHGATTGAAVCAAGVEGDIRAEGGGLLLEALAVLQLWSSPVSFQINFLFSVFLCFLLFKASYISKFYKQVNCISHPASMSQNIVFMEGFLVSVYFYR